MISDEQRRLADETFGLIERSEHVQADQPAVTPEPDDEDYPALCNKTCPHDGTCTLPEDHAGDHEVWGTGTMICSWPQADQPAITPEHWHWAEGDQETCELQDDQPADEFVVVTPSQDMLAAVSLALAEHTAPALDAIRATTIMHEVCPLCLADATNENHENHRAEYIKVTPARFRAATEDMHIVDLSLDHAKMIVDALASARQQALIAYDPIDDAIKVKIDGGTWSPPFRSKS